MSIVDAFSKNSATGVGGPRTPRQGPQHITHQILPTHAWSAVPEIDLFAIEEHVALDVTWNAYQNIIDAYRAPNTRMGKAMTEAEINTLTSRRVPRGLTELITLGKTLKRRARDILAYYNHPHTTGDPTEVINGRPEHLCGSTPELAKLTHYITRALLETGEFRPEQHPQL
jgi:Transposase and inactivated derivatives